MHASFSPCSPLFVKHGLFPRDEELSLLLFQLADPSRLQTRPLFPLLNQHNLAIYTRLPDLKVLVTRIMRHAPHPKWGQHKHRK